MNIAIVGGGLMGSLLAFELSLSGKCAVTIFDTAKSAAMVAAGMVAPYTELEKSPCEVVPLGLLSLQRWPIIIKRLEEALGQPLHFKQHGSLVTALPSDQSELSMYCQKIQVRSKGYVPERVQVNALEPEISGDDGYYFSEEGHLDSQAVMKALYAYLSERVSWVHQKVDRVEDNQVHCLDAIQYFDRVFDCRGNEGKPHFSELRSVRGEVICLLAPQVTITRPIRLLHPRYSVYIVPQLHSHYMIGASEIEVEDYAPIVMRHMMELLSAAYAVHKGFIDSHIVRTAVHCRPALPDHLPAIKCVDRLVAINGLYRHGFLLAPALAYLLVKNFFSDRDLSLRALLKMLQEEYYG